MLLLLFNISYFLSLKGWPVRPLSIGEWLSWLKQNGSMLTLFGIISWLMFLTLMILMIHRVVHFIWLIPAAGNLVFIWFIDGDTNFVNHGMINRSLVLAGIWIFLLIYFIVLLIIFICKRGRIYIIISKKVYSN